jgi:orotate phosphoribosyltransferase
MIKDDLIKRLGEIGVISNAPVMLRSGVTAEFYCDIKKAYGYSDVLSAFVEEIGKRIGDDITAITGSGYGGLPLAAILALKYQRHFILVRDNIKDHGKKEQFDGYVPTKDDRVLIVDDVLTTGSSVRATIAALEGTEATISEVIVLVKRGEVELPVNFSYILHIDELL